LGVLAVALLVSGCAATVKSSESAPDQQEVSTKGPNPGGQVARGCLGASLAFLKAGPVGVPFTLGIPVVCLPLAAAAGVLHEIVPAAGPHDYSASYYSPTVFRSLTDEERSVFPKTSASGCIRDGC
jgi:hypothetical protein